jgi:Helix-turn-helix
MNKTPLNNGTNQIPIPATGKKNTKLQKEKLSYFGVEDFQVFDEASFHQAFAIDLENARESVIIHSPFISQRGVERYRESIASLREREVQLCAYIQEPDDWIQRNQNILPIESSSRLEQLECSLADLQLLGAHVNLRRRAHEKLAVIDDSILWEGSLNILSHRNTSERMTRWVSPNQVTSAVVKHKLDECSHCWSSGGCKLLTDEQLHAKLLEISSELARKRKYLGLSQREIGASIGTDQSLISRFEHGSCAINSKTVIHIASRLGYELVLVPTLLRHSVDEMVARQLRARRTNR